MRTRGEQAMRFLARRAEEKGAVEKKKRSLGFGKTRKKITPFRGGSVPSEGEDQRPV